MYEKVGRLKPDQNQDCIQVIVAGQGEIGTITREDTEELLSGVEPQAVQPSGSIDLSVSEKGVKVVIPVEGQLYVTIVRQVRNVLNKWPRRKAAVFRPVDENFNKC
jgi:hypothetical protein